MATNPKQDSSKAAGANQSIAGAPDRILATLASQIDEAAKSADYQQHAALSFLHTHLVEIKNKIPYIEGNLKGEGAEIAAMLKRVL